jgi:hypothetical protein
MSKLKNRSRTSTREAAVQVTSTGARTGRPATTSTQRAVVAPEATTANERADDDVFAALVELFVRADPRSCCHWNTETGEHFWLRRPRRQQVEREAFEARLFEEDGWVEVPWLESDDAYAMAKSFVEALEPGRGRTALLVALASPKPFRAFRTEIAARPGLARRWREAEVREATQRLCTIALSLDVPLGGDVFARLSTDIRAADDAREREDRAADARQRAAAAAASGRVPLTKLGIMRKQVGPT